MHQRPLAAAVAAASVALTAVMTAPTASAATAPEPVIPLPANGNLVVLGKGFGHGRGMSQFGAAGAAAAGRTWSQITAAYYPGAVATATPARSLRVGLADTIGTGLRVLPAPGLTARNGTLTRVLPTSDTYAGVTSPIVRWEVQLPAGGAPGSSLWFVTAAGRRAPLATAADTWTFTSTAGSLRVTSPTGTPGATYLGSLSAPRVGTTITPVLTTTLESYVRMVVPNEVYSSWPGQALAAQAVAARTYAVSYLRTHTPTTSDICSSTRCQVLGGIQTETASTKTAVNATAGTVLTSNGIPINAEFSSSNGGWTASGGTGYLPAKADGWDRNPLNPVNSWRSDIPVSKIAAAYPAIGRPTGLQVLSRDGRGEYGGRILSARVIGTLGETTVTGDNLRGALGTAAMRSTLASFSATPTRTTSPTGGTLLAATPTTLLAATTATTAARDVAALGPRLLTRVGEWDAVAGVDALGIDGSGRLVLISSVGTPSASTRVVAAGFGDVSAITTLADMNGDKQRDLVVRRGDGHLQRYTADGRGGILPGTPSVVGSGWTGIPALFGADLDGNRADEMIALLPDGTVVAYPASRDVLSARRVIGRLVGFRSVSSQGDRTGDGRADLVALDSEGAAWLLPTTTAGTLGSPVRLATLTGTAHLL